MLDRNDFAEQAIPRSTRLFKPDCGNTNNSHIGILWKHQRYVLILTFAFYKILALFKILFLHKFI